MNKLINILIVVIILSLSLSAATPSPSKTRTLRDIYKSGKITFKPILKIDRDSIPDDIATKALTRLMPMGDKLFMADSKMHDLKSFYSDGRFYKKFSLQGRGPGDSFFPHFLCVSKDRLLVWEIGNTRVSYYDQNGTFIKIETPEVGKTTKRMVMDMKALDDGRVIFESYAAGYDDNNQPAFEWHILDLYSSEMKFIKEIYRQKEHGYRYFKNPRREIALPFTPRLEWDVLKGGKVVVCFSEKYEIKIIDLNTGQTKTFSQLFTRLKVIDIDIQEYLKFDWWPATAQGNEEIKAFLRKNLIFPDYKPAISYIHTDFDGHILVFLYTPAQEKGKVNTVPYSFDVWDAQGNKINHVLIQGENSIAGKYFFSGSNNVFWMYESDEDDDIYFQKYLAQ